MTQFQDFPAPQSNEQSKPRLSIAQWSSLPMCTQVSSRLCDILLLLDELRADLQCEDAKDLRWMLPTIDRVSAETDLTLRRLAS